MASSRSSAIILLLVGGIACGSVCSNASCPDAIQMVSHVDLAEGAYLVRLTHGAQEKVCSLDVSYGLGGAAMGCTSGTMHVTYGGELTITEASPYEKFELSIEHDEATIFRADFEPDYEEDRAADPACTGPCLFVSIELDLGTD